MTKTPVRLGFVMLVHGSLERAAEVARYWAGKDCAVVIHVDARVDDDAFQSFRTTLEDVEDIRYCARRKCEWGQYSIVEATQLASELMLQEFADVTHVFLASGSCLPLRPAGELRDFLEQRPRTEFIESVTTEEVPWTVDGLDLERFTLRFPFSWKKNRALFDRYVNMQRRFGVLRKIPKGIEPHLGSQWWCLTRRTLTAILEDPQRAAYDQYFRKVWIPDEAYFQTLVRKYASKIESRSLTLSKFDYQGKPHIFYDDHLQLLRRSDCFVARKIWPEANVLYSRFLSDDARTLNRVDPNPRKLDKIFARAINQRTKGRDGLVMQSRFPDSSIWGLNSTCATYSVFEGFSDLFENFETWLQKRTNARVHGHLFAKRKVKFAGGVDVYNGCLPSSAKLRDYNPQAFLSNLIWNTQGEHQSFQLGPNDNQDIASFLADDPNATISIVSGAWAVQLFHSDFDFSRIRKIAARCQRVESEHIRMLQSPTTRARVNIWPLSEFIEDPMLILQKLIDEVNFGARRQLTEVPKMADLEGFGQFVQNLRNQGMNPHLVGDFPSDEQQIKRREVQRPYLVR